MGDRTYKVVTSKGPQGTFSRDQIVRALKAGKLSPKAIVVETTTNKFLEASDLATEGQSTNASKPASPVLQVLDSNQNGLAPGIRKPMNSSSSAGSKSVIAIVVAALLIFALFFALKPQVWNEDVAIGSATNSPSKQPDARATPRSNAPKDLPTTTDNNAAEIEEERQRWREGERKRLLKELAENEAAAKREAERERKPEVEVPPKNPSETVPASSAERFMRFAESCNPSVFLVYVSWQATDGDGKAVTLGVSAGTGWLAGNGLLVTNKHVLFSFLFNPKQCYAIKWLCENMGWKIDPKSVFVAAFPCGAAIRQSAGSELRFNDAWILDGTSKGLRGQGKMRFLGCLQNDWERFDWFDSTSDQNVSVEAHAVESANDLALLQLEGGSIPPPLLLANKEDLAKLKQLDQVMTLGYPGAGNIDDGTVLTTEPALGTIRSVELALSRIRTTASTIGGNSGGPLISINGTVIGVSSRAHTTDRNTSITVDRVVALLDPNVRVSASSFCAIIEQHFPTSPPSVGRVANKIAGTEGERKSGTISGDEFVASLAVSDFKKSSLSPWQGLKKGLTSDEVRKLVGPPPEESADSVSKIWSYPNSKGGRVFFDQETSLVKRWIAPWERVVLGQDARKVEGFIGVCDQVFPTKAGKFCIYRFGDRLMILWFNSSDELQDIRWKS